MYQAAKQIAEEWGLFSLSKEQVELAEMAARGHVDYGAKWAYRVIRDMGIVDRLETDL